MAVKKSHKFKEPFDDRGMPVNDLSLERSEQIEKLAMPLLEEAFKKLKTEQPHLFKPISKK